MQLQAFLRQSRYKCSIFSILDYDYKNLFKLLFVLFMMISFEDLGGLNIQPANQREHLSYDLAQAYIGLANLLMERELKTAVEFFQKARRHFQDGSSHLIYAGHRAETSDMYNSVAERLKRRGIDVDFLS